MSSEGWKYVPDTMTVVHGRCSTGGVWVSEVAVKVAKIWPTVPPEATCIRKDLESPVLERRAECGCVRFQAVKGGRINSELRAVIIPFNDRDESVNRWESCTTI